MWGVSWANIVLTMIDAQRTDYESKRENKKNSRSNDNDVLDLSNLADIEKLKRMAR